MLSRLALRQCQLLSVGKVLPVVISHQSTESSLTRPVRPEYPSPCRHGFIPEEWFTFFYNKTGASGPYLFGGGLLTYLYSKEILICDHEFYNGLSLLFICIVGIKKFGPSIAAFLDKQIDNYEASWTNYKSNEIQSCHDAIAAENKAQKRTEAQNLIFEIKKQNIAMQLEAVYRERMNQVYTEVKKRLDYQVNIKNVERRIAQKHMSQWIINTVLKAITPEQEKAALQQCIVDLERLAAAAKA